MRSVNYLAWIKCFDAAGWLIKDLLSKTESYLEGDPINVLLIDFRCQMEFYQSFEDRNFKQSTPWGLQKENVLTDPMSVKGQSQERTNNMKKKKILTICTI